jgi:hypothetical protein
MNFAEVRGPYGGANSFLRALRKALRRRGVVVHDEPDARFDVALVNALTQDIDRTFVERLAEGGPLVHRKVGYRVSGSDEMRRVVDGVVHGDRLQIDFSPWLAHSIFQSRYSSDVFHASGFDGPSTVIHNGVDEEIFNLTERRPLGRARPRTWWNGTEPFRVVISTWSTDANKGFAEYREIDAALGDEIEVRLVGRVPPGLHFRRIRLLRARSGHRLAAVLKRQHSLLQLARHETCSNALLEGINCGLPAIYLESGSNGELAAEYGVPWNGSLPEAVERLKERYRDAIGRIPENPYRVEPVADRYLEVLERVASG